MAAENRNNIFGKKKKQLLQREIGTEISDGAIGKLDV